MLSDHVSIPFLSKKEQKKLTNVEETKKERKKERKEEKRKKENKKIERKKV